MQNHWQRTSIKSTLERYILKTLEWNLNFEINFVHARLSYFLVIINNFNNNLIIHNF